jgi:crotonobetainyl-CoA:carnitine CoA-transferase CaiB-like acyl-CoA transferase
VLIENYRPGTMERMGFGYEAQHASNPRLIYCSISGFGRTGPYANRGGFDLVAQAMSGLMSITGEGPGCPPVKLGAPVTDITAGILACVGILAALHSRASSGLAQMVRFVLRSITPADTAERSCAVGRKTCCFLSFTQLHDGLSP